MKKSVQVKIVPLLHRQRDVLRELNLQLLWSPPFSILDHEEFKWFLISNVHSHRFHVRCWRPVPESSFAQYNQSTCALLCTSGYNLENWPRTTYTQVQWLLLHIFSNSWIISTRPLSVSGIHPLTTFAPPPLLYAHACTAFIRARRSHKAALSC